MQSDEISRETIHNALKQTVDIYYQLERAAQATRQDS